MNDVAAIPADRESLPPNWCMATIGDLAEYVSRGRAPSYVDESATPVINQRCIRWHGIDFDYVKYTDDTKVKGLADEQFLRSGDVLWNSTGTGTIGRATVFHPTARFSRVVVDTHVTIVRSKAYVPELLRYWIASAAVQNQIGEMQLGSTNQVELSRERVLNTVVPVPPFPEQERIVAKIDELLSELDAGVAGLKRARALLKKYRQAVLKAAVTGELTRDWRERHKGEVRESGAELLQRILTARRAAWETAELKKLRAKGKPPRDDRWKQKYKDPQPLDTTGLPDLPERWVWATVDQLCAKVANGLSKKPRGGPPGAPILRISAVRPMSVDVNDVRYYPTDTGEELDDYIVNRGDLLFTRYNGSFELVGVCGAMTAERPILHPDKLIRAKLASQEMTDAELLAAFLSAGVSRAFIERHIKTTAGQHGIAGSDIKRAPIPLPPVSEQQAIISLIAEAWTSSDQTEHSMETELLRADRTRQSILKAAFSGQLVPQDPNDEPASVLLERIRAERAAEPEPARGRRRQAAWRRGRQLELLE